MQTRPEPRHIVTYHSPDGEWQDEYATQPPMIGYGIELPTDSRRFRIVDVWIIHEKHGILGYGVHAFLEPVTYEDDTPANLHPEYYRP